MCVQISLLVNVRSSHISPPENIFAKYDTFNGVKMNILDWDGSKFKVSLALYSTPEWDSAKPKVVLNLVETVL